MTVGALAVTDAGSGELAVLGSGSGSGFGVLTTGAGSGRDVDVLLGAPVGVMISGSTALARRVSVLEAGFKGVVEAGFEVDSGFVCAVVSPAGSACVFFALGHMIQVIEIATTATTISKLRPERRFLRRYMYRRLTGLPD